MELNGWFKARARYIAPKIVSGLEVNASMASSGGLACVEVSLLVSLKVTIAPGCSPEPFELI